ncbi:hypothetical protein TrST_g10233 [Triparma strigata]|uniref:Uncharacterized protein n=1 Tax=Triparma strigata TaxID=1606541 RepID=A0A9W7EBQ9_9STRA|nr:hypothetical protein TrST_g10233 [Triparma strigata]
MTSSSLSSPLSSLPQTSIDDLRKLHEENAILKTTLGTLKEQLQIDLEEERYQQQQGDSPSTEPFVPSFVLSDHSPQPPRSSISSISAPAVLWRELQLERKRSQMYRKECGSLRGVVDTLREGDIIDKLTHRIGVLEGEILEIRDENIALNKIQKFQETKLMSEETLEQEWPLRIYTLEQDISILKAQLGKAKVLASTFRKEKNGLSDKVKQLAFEKAELVKEIEDVKSREGNGGGSDTFESLRSEIRGLQAELKTSSAQILTFKQSSDSFKGLMEASLRKERMLCREKDKELIETKRMLDNARDDARLNILNMKELKKTLNSLTVGNFKVKEVSKLLPEDSKVEGLDLTCFESLLPQEIDVERTQFMSPRPPVSEVKRELRWGKRKTTTPTPTPTPKNMTATK